MQWWNPPAPEETLARQPRRDAPGAVHHVMTRGNERRDIFLDDFDRRDLVARLERLIPEWGGGCFAWCLMTNHVHLIPVPDHSRWPS